MDLMIKRLFMALYTIVWGFITAASPYQSSTILPTQSFFTRPLRITRTRQPLPKKPTFTIPRRNKCSIVTSLQTPSYSTIYAYPCQPSTTHCTMVIVTRRQRYLHQGLGVNGQGCHTPYNTGECRPRGQHPSPLKRTSSTKRSASEFAIDFRSPPKPFPPMSAYSEDTQSMGPRIVDRMAREGLPKTSAVSRAMSVGW